MQSSATQTKKAAYCPDLIICDGEYNPKLEQLQRKNRPIVVDCIDAQLAELIRLQAPDQRWSDDEALLAARARLGEQPERYGTWVYYPWKNTLVHLLSESEFIAVRTNRNQLKITAHEQDLLRGKCVGIIGMSVGSGIALTMAMERTCGTLRIADFDTLDLSNLNRLRSSVTQLGVSKAWIVAREIAEIDPYLTVEVFDEGVNAENIDQFIDGSEQRLDLLVEECDSLPIKILARLEARKRAMPVIMETSDRGMVDVERFDLDPRLGILHGRISDDECDEIMRTGSWTPELTARIMRPDETSERMLRSVQELGKRISRWPQLASEVTAGAGVVTHLSRKILLGDHLIRGRKFMDPYELFVD